ncbi:MAG: peptide chain release factor family protein [Kiritimatiellia bacterium]
MENPGIKAEKWQQLRLRMEYFGIQEGDVTEQFVQGFGPGGQKINKTSSCVVLSYPPKGLVIKCQQTRSRALNRYYARVELCERIAEQTEGELSKRQQLAEKIRRQKRRRSRRQQAKMLEDKHHQSVKKALRQKPDFE